MLRRLMSILDYLPTIKILQTGGAARYIRHESKGSRVIGLLFL